MKLEIATHPRRARRGIARTRRYSVCEPLESRIAPAAVSWTGASGGNWNVAGNWSGGAVPGMGDDVTINHAGATLVLIDSGAFAVNSLNVIGDDVLQMTGGSLSVALSSTISHLDVSNATLTATTLVTLTGTSSISGDATLGGDGAE